MCLNNYDELMFMDSDDICDDIDNYEPTNIFYYIYKFVHSFFKYCSENSIII